MSVSHAKNVVLISIDTLRYDCVGVCPDKQHLAAWGAQSSLHTPNLDAFFSDSVYFPRCMTTAPYTTAAHASVMTGLYPNSHGVRPFYKWALADGVGTLAEELKARGYATAAVQESGDETALRTGAGILRGFDAFFSEEVEACAWRRAQDTPCLLFIHTFDVHAPYCWSAVREARTGMWQEAEKEIFSRLGRERPAGGVQGDKTRFHGWVAAEARRVLEDKEAVRLMLDWYIRGVNAFDAVRWPRIVGALRDGGLYDSSIIVVFADHGEALLPDFAGPPMSHAASLLEDAIRVPLAIRGCATAPATIARQVSLVDVAPTVMDCLELEPQRLGRQGATDGRSLLREQDEVPLFAEAWRSYGGGAPAGRMLAQGLDSPCEPYQVCVKWGADKLIWHPGAPMLRRFMPQRARRSAALKGLLRRHLPGFLLRALKGLLRRWRRLRKRSSQPDASNALRWREAPAFAFNLKDDPLEERPRRLADGAMSPRYSELMRRLRSYWESGVAGPPIRLGVEDEQQVLDHLKGLGYVD
ncbi:MAG: sulfatase-like hydrolase/transferase [Planctomycetes bacterium]|nr:sulfatase-like hydrolase/transferase [Planctomycetota bacterium]